MQVTREKLKNMMNEIPTYKECLNDQQNKVLNLYINGCTFQEIGRVISLSGSRIRQIVVGTNRFGKKSIYKKLITEKQKMKIVK